MLIQQLIFTVISFALFVFTFYKMIKSNDTTYVAFIVLQAIGITINFISVLLSIELNTVLKIIMYIVSIIIPIMVFILEKTHHNIIETIKIIKAKILFNMGNSKKAKQVLIELLNKQPQSYKGHKLLAQIYESEGGQRKSIEEYVQAIDIEKRDYDSYFKVANLLNGLDRKNEAREMLNNLLQKKPDYKEASILLGDLLIEQEMYKEALNVYHEALKFEPLDFDINYSLGIAYTMVNDFKSAKEYYDKASSINTYTFTCKYALAEIALIYKELEEAESKFMEALNDEELAPDSYFELSKLNLIKGDKQKAVQYANLAISLKPKSISEKIKKDTIFIPIMAKLAIPFNLDTIEEKTSQLTLKEITSKKHLEEMADITRNIGYNDIQMFSKPNKEKTENKEEEINIEDNIESKDFEIDNRENNLNI